MQVLQLKSFVNTFAAAFSIMLRSCPRRIALLSLLSFLRVPKLFMNLLPRFAPLFFLVGKKKKGF